MISNGRRAMVLKSGACTYLEWSQHTQHLVTCNYKVVHLENYRKKDFFFPVGNPAENLTLLSWFVLGHTSKALAFNSHVCSTYLAALPVFAKLLGTVIQSSCLIRQWP